MSHRSRVVLGSLGGAFAIHLAVLACSMDRSSLDAPSDATVADGGVAPTHDGGVLDAISVALDAVGDAVRDVAAKVVDAEVRDARAGGDPVQTMSAPCVASTDLNFPDSYIATFAVSGFNTNTAGAVNARVCGYPCTNGGFCSASGSFCVEATTISSVNGSVVVHCGPTSAHGATARIWLR